MGFVGCSIVHELDSPSAENIKNVVKLGKISGRQYSASSTFGDLQRRTSRESSDLRINQALFMRRSGYVTLSSRSCKQAFFLVFLSLHSMNNN